MSIPRKPSGGDTTQSIAAYVRRVEALEEAAARCDRYEQALRWIAWWWHTAPDRDERPYISEKRAVDALRAEGRDYTSKGAA